MTDRWQRFTDVKPDTELLEMLSAHCSEFLVHGVDAEGKSSGMEEGLVQIFGKWEGIPRYLCQGLGISGIGTVSETWKRTA